jgi:NAD(P)H-flavin reductase
MYQIATAIIRDPADTTRVHLLFANRTEYDILLINELDALAAQHPDRFYIYHILSRPKNQAAWDETGHFSGYVSEEVLAQIFPRGGK